ncbi:protein of unknown function [Rhodovastum atsumiense]|nr:protein of unknown function [Rhodovastum atsumiense]
MAPWPRPEGVAAVSRSARAAIPPCIGAGVRGLNPFGEGSDSRGLSAWREAVAKPLREQA